MKLAIISFTRAGSLLCRRLVRAFREESVDCLGYIREQWMGECGGEPGILPADGSATEWTGRQFHRADGLVYIGAAGIAVRAVAPWLKDKMTDPAVLCIDEQGQFVISLLSGHVGGANELARRTAKLIGAVPVVTTASDVQGCMAVDEWARAHGLMISDREEAKHTAAALVNGEDVGFYSDFAIPDGMPEGYVCGQKCRRNVWVTCRQRPEPGRVPATFLTENGGILRLIPRALSVGIGCRKETPSGQIEAAVRAAFQENNLDFSAIFRVASVDLKRGEAGLHSFASSIGVLLVTFSAAELNQAAGEFTESEFVRSVTGSGSVCERAAVLGAGARGSDVLLVRKTARDGVTVAVALDSRWKMRRDE